MDATNSPDISENQKGVSNSTIAVLVIVALVISMIGTFAVIMGTGSPPTTSAVYGTSVGKVSFQIEPSTDLSQSAPENPTG